MDCRNVLDPEDFAEYFKPSVGRRILRLRVTGSCGGRISEQVHHPAGLSALGQRSGKKRNSAFTSGFRAPATQTLGFIRSNQALNSRWSGFFGLPSDFDRLSSAHTRRGRSSVVECELPKLEIRVRSPSPVPALSLRDANGRPYRGRKGSGYGVCDFRVPCKGGSSRIVGYGTPPGLID